MKHRAGQWSLRHCSREGEEFICRDVLPGYDIVVKSLVIALGSRLILLFSSAERTGSHEAGVGSSGQG